MDIGMTVIVAIALASLCVKRNIPAFLVHKDLSPQELIFVLAVIIHHVVTHTIAGIVFLKKGRKGYRGG
jgi:hypothetical protein